MSLLHGSTLSLHRIVNHSAYPPWEIHGYQRVLWDTPLEKKIRSYRDFVSHITDVLYFDNYIVNIYSACSKPLSSSQNFLSITWTWMDWSLLFFYNCQHCIISTGQAVIITSLPTLEQSFHNVTLWPTYWHMSD